MYLSMVLSKTVCSVISKFSLLLFYRKVSGIEAFDGPWYKNCLHHDCDGHCSNLHLLSPAKWILDNHLSRCLLFWWRCQPCNVTSSSRGGAQFGIWSRPTHVESSHRFYRECNYWRANVDLVQAVPSGPPSLSGEMMLRPVMHLS